MCLGHICGLCCVCYDTGWDVGWLLYIPAACECISGSDLLRQFRCCHTEIEVADLTFHLTQSQYTDSRLTTPSADPIAPGAWQGSHWSANFEVTGMTGPRKNPATSGIRTWDLEADVLTTGPRRRFMILGWFESDWIFVFLFILPGLVVVDEP